MNFQKLRLIEAFLLLILTYLSRFTHIVSVMKCACFCLRKETGHAYQQERTAILLGCMGCVHPEYAVVNEWEIWGEFYLAFLVSHRHTHLEHTH
jgi:hypothetical protein